MIYESHNNSGGVKNIDFYIKDINIIEDYIDIASNSDITITSIYNIMCKFNINLDKGKTYESMCENKNIYKTKDEIKSKNIIYGDDEDKELKVTNVTNIEKDVKDEGSDKGSDSGDQTKVLTVDDLNKKTKEELEVLIEGKRLNTKILGGLANDEFNKLSVDFFTSYIIACDTKKKTTDISNILVYLNQKKYKSSNLYNINENLKKYELMKNKRIQIKVKNKKGEIVKEYLTDIIKSTLGQK